MLMDTIEMEPKAETVTAEVARPPRPRRRPAEPQGPTPPPLPCLQAIHASQEGFILRGTRSDTFWEW